MTVTKKQFLPALHKSDKVKNPDMPSIEDSNYTSTILKYANLALPFPQLDTTAKTVVAAINELYATKSTVIPNPPDTPQYTLYTVKIDGDTYRLSGGSTVIPNPPIPVGSCIITESGDIILTEAGDTISSNESSEPVVVPKLYTISIDGEVYEIAGGEGKTYSAGGGIYFTGDADEIINADAGRFSPTYLTSKFDGYYSRESKNAWKYSGTTIEENKVYVTDAGTSSRVQGVSLGTITVTGTETTTLYVKQDSDDVNTAYVVIGKPDVTFITDTTDTFTGDGTTKRFTVSHLVYEPGDISGGVPGSIVRWSGNEVVFSAAPAAGSTITANYTYIDTTDSSKILKSYKGTTTSDYVSCIVNFGSGSVGTNLYQRNIEVLYIKDGNNTIYNSKAYFYYALGTPYQGSSGEVFNAYSDNVSDGNFAIGYQSHAEGGITWAFGNRSHAEGNGAKAIGSDSHAEGQGEALGSSSHAEGLTTHSKGVGSHAEGDSTNANGDYSHAEGSHTWATNRSAHAEGETTQASEIGSHAEGIATIASGMQSHAEGNRTQALAPSTHAEGNATVASGNNSHAEGSANVSSGAQSHAEGDTNVASGTNSHVEGHHSIASGREQHVFGKYNIEDTTTPTEAGHRKYVEIVGNGTADDARSNARTLDWNGNEVLAGKITIGTGPTNSMDVATKQYVDEHSGGGIPSIRQGEGTAAERFNQDDDHTCVASGDYSHAEGMDNQAAGRGSHTEGWTNTTNAPYSHVEGTRNVVIGSSPRNESQHAEGSGNTATGHESHIEGSGSLVGGTSGHTEGAGNYNIANTAHVEGGGNKNVAAAKVSHTEGGGNTNYGSQSHVEGGGNIVSGQNSHAEGGGNQIHGAKNHVEGGGNQAYVYGSHIEGKHNVAVGASIHVEGALNKVGVTSNTIDAFTFGTVYAVGDIVGINALYNDSENELNTACLYRCITAPGQCMADASVSLITPATWDSTTAYSVGDVVAYIRTGNNNMYRHIAYYYCVTASPAGTLPTTDSYWSPITEYLSPFTEMTAGYYLVDPTSELYGSMPIAKVTGTVAAMWEPIDTPISTHIEGYYNIALGNYQHVGGKYNVADANKAVIIGNGADANNRANAYTLDWNGNATFAGDITLGTPLSTTAQTVAAAINELYASSGGSTVTVTQKVSTGTNIADITVDGTTTQLFAPTSGGSNVVVTPVQLTGDHIADIQVDGVTSELYSPAYTPTEVVVTQVQSSGTQIASISVDGTSTSIYAPDSVSAVTVTAELSTGTKVATIDVDGTSTDIYAPDAGDSVTVTQITSTGTHIADIEVDGVTTELYAPSAGGAIIDDNDIALDKTWSSYKINTMFHDLAERVAEIERYLWGQPVLTEDGDNRVTEEGDQRMLEENEE